MGLPRGEFASLKWADVDFERATALISRAVVKLPHQEAVVKDTKTHIVATIALRGGDRRISPPANRGSKGVSRSRRVFEDQGYVFAAPLGGVPSPGSMSHAIHRIAVRAKTSVRGAHAMRHSTASWMLHEGADIRTVQAVLRHSAASTTLNTYAHEIEGRKPPPSPTSIAI